MTDVNFGLGPMREGESETVSFARDQRAKDTARDNAVLSTEAKKVLAEREKIANSLRIIEQSERLQAEILAKRDSRVLETPQETLDRAEKRKAVDNMANARWVLTRHFTPKGRRNKRGVRTKGETRKWSVEGCVLTYLQDRFVAADRPSNGVRVTHLQIEKNLKQYKWAHSRSRIDAAITLCAKAGVLTKVRDRDPRKPRRYVLTAPRDKFLLP